MFKFTLVLMTLAVTISAHAHGEDKPGPHGGHIKMPANFHTEVVPQSDGSYLVYLLDMEFKNPSIKNSDVKAHILLKNKKSELVCKAMNDHFHCSGHKTKKGALIIQATREGTAASMQAKYTLPFKQFKNVAPASQEHSHH